MDGLTKLILTWFPGAPGEEVDVCTFNDFAEANTPEDCAIVAALRQGESHTFGGGAAPEVRVVRGPTRWKLADPEPSNDEPLDLDALDRAEFGDELVESGLAYVTDPAGGQ